MLMIIAALLFALWVYTSLSIGTKMWLQLMCVLLKSGEVTILPHEFVINTISLTAFVYIVFLR